MGVFCSSNEWLAKDAAREAPRHTALQGLFFFSWSKAFFPSVFSGPNYWIRCFLFLLVSVSFLQCCLQSVKITHSVWHKNRCPGMLGYFYINLWWTRRFKHLKYYFTPVASFWWETMVHLHQNNDHVGQLWCTLFQPILTFLVRWQPLVAIVEVRASERGSINSGKVHLGRGLGMDGWVKQAQDCHSGDCC